MTDEQELNPDTPADADAQDAQDVQGEQPEDAPTPQPPAEDRASTEAAAARPQPPRAFDADPEADTPGAAASDDAEGNEGSEGSEGGELDTVAEPEVIAEAAEPEQAEAFEDLDQLPSLLEALLFVADHPIDVPYLSRAVDVSQARVERALDELAEALRDSGRGIRLQRGPAGVQLTSAPEAAAFVERFLGLEANRRLSTAALETLAIIAYRQPITRGQVDQIRGVSSDGAIATLRARDLIESAGHATGPGRPTLFRTTARFLEHFGLERPGQLPPLPEDVDLPPSEIQATLGLDEATIAEALRPRDPEPDTDAATDAARGAPDEPATAGDLAYNLADNLADDTPTAEDEALDELIQAVAAADAAGVEITSDIQALSAAAEHAFIASRDRADAEPEDAEDADPEDADPEDTDREDTDREDTDREDTDREDSDGEDDPEAVRS